MCSGILTVSAYLAACGLYRLREHKLSSLMLMGDATGLDKIIVNARPSLHTKSLARYLKLNVSPHNHAVITRRVLGARDYVQTPSREVSCHRFWVPGVWPLMSII